MSRRVTMASVLESHGPCESFALSKVRIGLETTEIERTKRESITVESDDRPAYALRSAVVCALARVLEADAERRGCVEGTTDKAIVLPDATRDALLELAAERARDVSHWTRSCALRALGECCAARAIPVAWFVRVAQIGAERLRDKSSLVRKAALTLLAKLLEYNPYGPSLAPEPFERQAVALEHTMDQLDADRAAKHKHKHAKILAKATPRDEKSADDDDCDDDQNDQDEKSEAAEGEAVEGEAVEGETEAEPVVKVEASASEDAEEAAASDDSSDSDSEDEEEAEALEAAYVAASAAAVRETEYARSCLAFVRQVEAAGSVARRLVRSATATDPKAHGSGRRGRRR